MFPELKDTGKYTNASEIILDTEAIGVDEERKKLANFQVTMTRRRKHAIEEKAGKIPIKFYVFDAPYINGASLMNKSYIERRKALEKSVNSGLFSLLDLARRSRLKSALLRQIHHILKKPSLP